MVLGDIVWLFNTNVGVSSSRITPRLLSLGDYNSIKLEIKNNASIALQIELIDELPYQLQKRDFAEKLLLAPKEIKTLEYRVRPIVRGEYHFGHVIIYLHSSLAFVSRRINTAEPQMVPVYPSIIQMKKFSLATNPKLSQFLGVKNMRRIGHSYEFEQIKNYVRGDDFRSVNWKATSRRGRCQRSSG